MHAKLDGMHSNIDLQMQRLSIAAEALKKAWVDIVRG
jgi:hypothetical protein